MHCGYIPREKWRSPAILPKSIGGIPYESDTCPGYLVRQPAVVQGAEAYAMLDAGIFDPDRSRVLTQAALLLRRAVNVHALEKMKPPGSAPPQGAR